MVTTVTTITPTRKSVKNGCADGTRESFVDISQYTNIAGCAAAWDGKIDVHDSRTLFPCGNDLGKCKYPKDACDSNWHVCGVWSNGGNQMSISNTDGGCASMPKAFVAGALCCKSVNEEY